MWTLAVPNMCTPLIKFVLQMRIVRDMSDRTKIGQINAVLYAAEQTINHPKADRGTMLMIKETAYDQIKQIMDGKNPWKEDEK